MAFTLMLAPAWARTAAAGGTRRDKTQRPATTVLRKLTFDISLEAARELDAADTAWEVSYSLRVGDQKDYMQWRAIKAAHPETPEPGDLLKKDSFSRAKLSRDANRRVVITLPMSRELLHRFRRSEEVPQVVWMNMTVRVRADKTKLSLIRDDISPLWPLGYFVKNEGKVIIGISPNVQLRWSINDPPPWGKGAGGDTHNQPL